MPKSSTARKLEVGDYSDPDTQRLFFGETSQDTIDWIETLLTIPSEAGQVVKFNLYPQQILMVENQTGRDLTVKGRQTRASSLILARNLRRMVTHWGQTCLVMTQTDQVTSTFRARIKHHLKDLERAGFPYKVGLDNDNELVLAETENRYIFASGQEQTGTGRAYAAQIAHLSEFAHWPLEGAATLLGGIAPSVPGATGWFDIESTPRGAEGKFHELVTSSKTYDPMSRWTTHFYPWWLEPRYRAGTTPGIDMLFSEEEWSKLFTSFVPTDEEERLMAEYSLDVGQIIWRRIQKKEQDKTNAPFLQEYVETIDGCFLTVGGNYFATPDGINHLKKFQDTVSPPKEIVPNVPGSSVIFPTPHLHVWQRPQMGRPYVVWVDCAGGGLDDSADYTAIIVLDAQEMFIAARLAVKVAPQEAAPMAATIAKYYNNALLGGERDAFGSVCVAKIQELGYRNLWFYMEPGSSMSIKKPILDPWGHPTQIRQHILGALRQHVFSGTFHTSDTWLVQQMGAFTWTKAAQKRHGLKEQGKGQKDDLVMSAAGCCYIAPQGRAGYAAKNNSRVSQPGEPLKETEFYTVGKFGLAERQNPGASQPMPWLR